MNHLSADKDRRILVIDDNPEILEDFRKILCPRQDLDPVLEASEAALLGSSTKAVRQIQFEVDSASQGEEGVGLVRKALAEGRPYAMAFVDIRMPPGWNGVSTTQKLWEIDPNIQVVICTAYADYSWDEIFEKIGSHDGLVILKKPFDTVEVLQLAYALTEKWWLHQQSQRKMGDLENRVAERTRELWQANQTLQAELVEHQRTEEAHARLATAVEQAGETIVITDANGAILYVNPAFERTTGYTCQEALGQNPRLLKSGKQEAEFYQRMWAMLSAGQVWRGHLINQRKDGTLYEEDATISPVFNPAGRIVNYVAVKRDVTREMALEAQYRQAQKMEAIGQLAGGVAHDFNNILAAFMMHLGLLRERPELDAEMREDLTELEAGARRAASLTGQLLMFSRRSVMQAKPLDLNEVVENLLRMLRRLIGEQIRLQFHASPALPRTHADAGMLEQVVMNLSINARDAMPQGGCLTLSTSVLELSAAQAAHYADRRPGRFVRLSVADTGTGMNKATFNRLFEPFFTTKEVGKGTGLGLATVYGIAKQHQGWVESVLGQGSTFHVFLPASNESAAQAAPVSDAKPICRGSETILLVEDEADVRTTITSFLRHYGYRVLGACNGPEALALWEKHRGAIDLLFTDMILPGGLTGLDLTAQLRKEKPGLKVVLSSGYSAALASAGNLAAHRITYLPKPAEPGPLAAAVRQCLDQSSA